MTNGVCKTKTNLHFSKNHRNILSKRSKSLVDKSRLGNNYSRLNGTGVSKKLGRQSVPMVNNKLDCIDHGKKSHSSCPDLTKNDFRLLINKTTKLTTNGNKPSRSGSKINRRMTNTTTNDGSNKFGYNTDLAFSMESDGGGISSRTESQNSSTPSYVFSSLSSSASSVSASSSANRSPSLPTDESTILGGLSELDHNKTITIGGDSRSVDNKSGIYLFIYSFALFDIV